MVHNLTNPFRGNSTIKINEGFEEKEITSLLQLQRERDRLFWELNNVERMIEAIENYDPNSEDVF